MKLADMEHQAEEAEGFLKALANRHRLMILCKLHESELSVGEILIDSELSQSALSQHLARLRADNLVQTRRESQTIYYSLADANVVRMIALLYDIYCGGKSAKKSSKASKTAKAR